MIPSRVERPYREVLIKYWGIANHMKSNKDKCWILYLQSYNPACAHRSWDKRLEYSPAERDLRALVGDQFNMSQQLVLVAKKASHILRYIKHGIGNQKDMIVPLHLALVQPHLKYCVQLWALQDKKDIKILKCVQRSAKKIEKGLEGMTNEA